jgi:DNA-binding beta-propeller fold protein YncE
VLGLEPVADGATLDLGRLSLGTEALHLRAETAATDLARVEWVVNGRTHADTTAPYTFPGPDAGWRLQRGAYTVRVTPHGRDGTAGAPLEVSFTVTGPEVARYLYVFRTAAVDIYDIDRGHERVRSLKLPTGINRIWGAVAHAESRRLYISYHGRDAQRRFETGLLAYDLVTEKVLWKRLYEPFVDSPAITPDGKTIYLASGEATERGDFWFVLDAEDGAVKDRIVVHKGSHNTIVGLSGERVYMGSVRYPYLAVADTATNEVIREVGPFSAGVRPFTVNGAETLAFVTVNQHLGFEVGDLVSGKKLYTVAVPGYPEAPWKSALHVQSHGVALSPDEREVWVVDGFNRSIHIFDVTGLPESAPRYLESVATPGKSPWVSFSRDGRFVYDAKGLVIDARTRQIVAQTSAAKVRLQIDFLDGVPAAAYSRYGLGYVTD